jgi:2,4-dienoyl-CoA reductase-like NADH-dependent reductase (Old Yellow Enzyme family)/thioredoxin reductase
MERLVKLFEPGKIGKLEVKNRIIMAPLGVPRVATKPGGYLSNEYLAYYLARARGGVGMIQMSISALGKPWASGLMFAPGSLSIIDDEHVPSAQRFVEAMHAYGVALSFQITHHGVVLSKPLEKVPPEKKQGVRIVSASSVPFAQTGVVPYALTTDEIQEIVEAFGQAARRGKTAGFDAVRIQGCHGYLIHQFLSPRTNKRNDAYGGTLEKRARFACDIIKRVREEVGPDYPVIIRFNGNDFLEGGITIDQAREHAKMFEEAGVDCLDVSGGPFETHHWQFVTMYQPAGPLIPAAAAIKKEVKVPIIVAGKIDPVLGEQILEDGVADFIHLGRPLMVDPDLPNKAKEGRLADIRPCIYCNACQREGDPRVMCAVNPAFGQETEFKIEPAAVKKNIMVVGGGPAGMEAARTLAERGHKVSLYEKRNKLGGQWNILSSYRTEELKLVNFLSRGLEKAGVKVFLNQEVTQQTVEGIKPDAVVIATGANPVVPENIPGISSKKVVMANDVLTGKVKVGQEVVIIGGHLVGLDVALFLGEQGKKVSVVEKFKIAWEVSHNLKLALMEYLIKFGVYLYPDSTLERVTDSGVQIVWDGGEPAIVGGPRFELLSLKADTVVLAIGSRSDSGLGERLKGFMPEVYNIGDSVNPRDVLAAIHEGSAIGRKI